MLLLLSPAKKLLSFSNAYSNTVTQPRLHSSSKTLIELMQHKSKAEIASLMHLSADLAQLNYDRYQNFYSDNVPLSACYPALLLFQGDVYQGLQAYNFSDEDYAYAQNHLAILSGLYGVLKPMDVIQPYRLEMGTRLINPRGSTLYDFWREEVTQSVNEFLSQQKNPLLLNLASNEYFKVIDAKRINYPIVTINFYEQKNNQMKMVGIYAKKARGMMARYIIQNKIDDLETLKQFNESGYHFHEDASSAQVLHFVRG